MAQHDDRIETGEHRGIISRMVSALRRRDPEAGREAGPSVEAAPVPASAAPSAERPGASAAADAPFVSVEQVLMGVELADRDEALAFISARAVGLGLADDAAELDAAFHRREAEGTTGMMDGFAIPHAKSRAIRRASVLVVRADAGIAGWDTMDELPVTVAIALLIPDSEDGAAHLRLLSRVAESLMDDSFRAAVMSAASPEDIARILNDRLR
ncbi:PTS sugar transporter subunit IIA [Candidatus Collinsella stercoripullorum]|uniref:PTS sugar transporter subunit IIA n=1 Tax=Candidatus Collinsella stercoripullorum TaxID=2838522 RepID=UPI0022DEB38B|nr:PTS sugar transporter subunit IIA [Candidatus Collinsella stercoripullorum]